ncbi:flagellar protein FlaG [bacterium]|nr:flagellar protein FlaG [bacterium]
MDLQLLFTGPGGGVATAETASPSGSQRLSDSLYKTQALLPSQLSPAGQRTESKDAIEKQEHNRRLEDIRQTILKVNDYMRLSDTHLEFIVAELTGRIVVQVVNTQSGEVIRQIPPDSVMRFAKTMTQLRGLLFEAQG